MELDGVFYIPSGALLAGIDKITLKDNESFAVLDGSGEAPRVYAKELGLFHRDTRFLDTWELHVNGEGPIPLAAHPRTNARSYVFVATNPDVASVDYDGRLARDRLRILRVVSLEDDQLFEQVEVVNYDRMEHTIRIERLAGSSFCDIFEVRGMVRAKRGKLFPPEVSPDRRTVHFRYQGRDDLRHTTEITVEPPCTRVSLETTSATLIHEIRIPPHGSATVKYVVGCDQRPRFEFHGKPFETLTASEHLNQITLLNETRKLPFPSFASTHVGFRKALSAAADDVASLITERDGMTYIDAGIPWFCAPFGRDGLITAYQLLPWQPDLAKAVLEFTLSRLGTKEDPFTDEEPGKVFHEQRFGEMARLKEIPFIPYFGSVDATPLALILLTEYASWTHDHETVRKHWEQATLALGWIRRKIAESEHGLLTYQAARDTGLGNQGWKDSVDSVMHADGRLARPPIALCEVQAYCYRALLGMSQLAETLGHSDEAHLFQRESVALSQRVRQSFWDENGGFMYLAVDGDGKPCRVRASNQGHCLWAKIVDQDQAQKIARNLMDPSFFSGHGIRTLAATEIAYNPVSYHNGSIWPHDNSLIAEGFRSYGCTGELIELTSGLLSVVDQTHDSRLPELFCGFEKGGQDAPVPYPVACKPQAWAAGSLFLMLRALLGLRPSADPSLLVFDCPHLPRQVDLLEIRGLRCPGAEVDVVVRRGALGCSVELLRRQGAVRLLVSK